MKEISILCLCLMLTGCVKQLPTTEQYCGQTLGLKYGTPAYAKCGMRYSEMKIQSFQGQLSSNIYVNKD